jgi:N-methylhydantoinase A
LSDAIRRGRYRIAADIGGTFTDVVAYDETAGVYATRKVPTTTAELSRGVLAGFEAVAPAADSVTFAVHGTTVALNAFLQRRGERVLLLTTAGTRDVYHIARGNRARIYDIQYRKPTPLVPRRDIIEVRGRLNYLGEELEPLSDEDLRAAAARARDGNFGAIAIALLFSYLNPEHELRAAEVLRQELGEVSISLSHRVAGEWREYERTSSTVLDAYTTPAVTRYLERLEDELLARSFSAPLHVMQSNGGIMSAAAARSRPLQTLLSGPVGGTIGAAGLAEDLEEHNLLCIDMGGTSFDVSLVVEGRPTISPETELEGFPILMPVVNIHTIGAGGGSLAYAEADGLRVGPQSAGAIPGPACYGKGGTAPTVTDANLLLGRIDPEYFLGGDMRLDLAAAKRAIGRLAAELRLDEQRLAEGVIDVINAKMAQAIRTITVEQGIEPRDFAIVAFGGAGPMHAAFLAQELEIGHVIIPKAPGAFSAWGMLQSVLRHDFVRPFHRPLETADSAEIVHEFEAMRTQGSAMLASDGVEPERIQLESSAEMRYEGQEYTINVSLTGTGFQKGRRPFDELLERFHEAYMTRYGHANRGAPVEFVALRLVARGDLGQKPPQTARDETGGDVNAGERLVCFAGEMVSARIIMRSALSAGSAFEGPAIVEEETATTVVPPGCRGEIRLNGAMSISVAPGRA